jgi:hypothetical protein
MDEKDTYVSGLEIKDNGNGGYDLIYNRKRFPNSLNLEEIGYITNPKSKAGIKRTFDSFFQILDERVDIQDARKEVLKQAKELIPDIMETNVVKEEIPDITSWDDFKSELENHIQGRTNDFLFVLSVIVSYWYADKECVYALLLAPRGRGKSSILNCFEKCEDVVLMDDWTMESLAPGTAQADQDTQGLLDY